MYTALWANHEADIKAYLAGSNVFHPHVSPQQRALTAKAFPDRAEVNVLDSVFHKAAQALDKAEKDRAMPPELSGAFLQDGTSPAALPTTFKTLGEEKKTGISFWHDKMMWRGTASAGYYYSEPLCSQPGQGPMKHWHVTLRLPINGFVFTGASLWGAPLHRNSPEHARAFLCPISALALTHSAIVDRPTDTAVFGDVSLSGIFHHRQPGWNQMHTNIRDIMPELCYFVSHWFGEADPANKVNILCHVDNEALDVSFSNASCTTNLTVCFHPGLPERSGMREALAF